MRNLLLHLFIITFPVHVYQVYMTTKHFKIPCTRRNKIVAGMLCGLSGVLCIHYPILLFAGEFRWDLRMIALMLAFFYGRGYGGWICFIMMSGYRFLLGGDAMAYGIAVHVVVSLACWWLGNNFLEQSRRCKVGLVIGSTMFSLVTKTIAMLIYFENFRLISQTEFSEDVVLLGYVFALQIACAILMMLWLDQIIESQLFRERLERTAQIQLLSEMAASVAHEVRNPLQVTRGFLQMSLRKSDGATRPYLQTALEELDRAASIITEYLAFAKPQLDEIIRIDVTNQLDHIHGMMQPMAFMDGVDLHMQCDGGMYLQGDPGKFTQIVMNLIKNSIEASHGKGTVFVHAFMSGSELLIRIKDEGEGMTEEEVRQLGIPFYSTKTKGTGLGLMVTFRLVEMMNGKLTFESKKGAGTEAVLRFPAA